MSTATVNIPSQILTYANLAAFPATGVLKTIYIAEDTEKTYRWNGSAYVEVSQGSASGVTSFNARTGAVTPQSGDYTKSDVGLSNVDNTSDANKPISTATQTALDGKEDETNKGIANGYASLDGSAKIPLSQIPDSVLGQVEYQGTWNASTNTPTLATPSGVKGYYYVVSVAGTYLAIDYNVGDWVISNGTAWEKVDNTDAVSSVAGLTGVISSASLKTALDLSGTNSGDNATNTTSNIYADGKITQVITNGVTDKAPSEDAVFDALALKQNIVSGVDDTEIGYLNGVTSSIQTQLDSKGISINYGFGSLNPLDGNNYHFCAFLTSIAPTTTAANRPMKFTTARTLKSVVFTDTISVNGSNETCTLYLTNVTAATDYTIGTFLLNHGANSINVNVYTGLSISVNTTDVWTWKMAMPTWATNPTALLGDINAEFI